MSDLICTVCVYCAGTYEEELFSARAHQVPSYNDFCDAFIVMKISGLSRQAQKCDTRTITSMILCAVSWQIIEAHDPAMPLFFYCKRASERSNELSAVPCRATMLLAS
jgi:hypothetical protein